MEEEAGATRRINNTQRKELAKLAATMLHSGIDRLSCSSHRDRRAARRDAKERSGVAEIEREIRGHERRVAELQRMLEDLGWRWHEPTPTSEVGLILAELTRPLDDRVAAMKKMAADVQERIWTAQTLDEAQAVLAEVKKAAS